MSATALVLGGTGHLGHALLRELLARGYGVRAATRQERPSALAELDVTVVQGDTATLSEVDRLVEDADVIVDAAAPYPLYLSSRASGALSPVREAVLRTQSLVEAARRRDAALVFISSFTTLPRPRGLWSDFEARTRRAVHPYFAVKEAMETVVLEACQRGLRAVIVNPTACIGPWDRKPRSLTYLPLLVSGEIPATTSRMVNVVDVRDVARGAVSALEAEVFARPLLLAGHDVRVSDLSALACALAARRPPIPVASARATATAAYWAEWLFSSVGLQAPFPSLPMLLLCEARATGIGETQRELGILPRPLEETLRDAIAWYRLLGHIRA